MTKLEITPEQALDALKAAKENRQLKPEHIKALEEFLSDARSTINVALATEHVYGAVTVDGKPSLIFCWDVYEHMPEEIRDRASWQSITEKLYANNYEKLKKVQEMQGGGEFVGIDKAGRALFKDKGTEPVMYGFDKEGKLLRIYDRNPEQMKKVEKWADYNEIRVQVLKEGYELFSDDGGYGFSDEMEQVTRHTEKHFVAGNNEMRASWLEFGDKPPYAKFICLYPNGNRPLIAGCNPRYRGNDYGAMRMLRV